MKILITGGSGLLGSKVAEIAKARGDEVFSGYAHHEPNSARASSSTSWICPGISDLVDRMILRS